MSISFGISYKKWITIKKIGNVKWRESLVRLWVFVLVWFYGSIQFDFDLRIPLWQNVTWWNIDWKIELNRIPKSIVWNADAVDIIAMSAWYGFVSNWNRRSNNTHPQEKEYTLTTCHFSLQLMRWTWMKIIRQWWTEGFLSTEAFICEQMISPLNIQYK